MSNKLPEKYENTFLAKVKRFFLNMFKKKDIIIEDNQVVQEKIVETKSEKTEFDKMKESSHKAKLNEDILSLVKENPNLIDTLSIDKIRELNNICDARIEELNRNIKKLKREIA